MRNDDTADLSERAALLDACLSGEVADSTLLASDPIGEAPFAAMVHAAFRSQLTSPDADETLATLHARLSQAGDGRITGTHHRPDRRGIGVPVITALVALIAVLATGHHTIASWLGGSTKPTAFAQTFSTKTGETVRVHLPDRTEIILAPHSTLRVESAFGAATRTVQLVGEAYFDVSSVSAHPFLVRTGTVVTRVLGTQFNVRRYPTDSTVRIAVVSGKVSVSRKLDSASIVTSGMVATASDSSTTVAPTDVSQYTSWVDGRLEFRGVPAAQVLSSLGRWYRYQFKFADSALANRKLTIGLSTKSAQSALQTLKVTLDVDLLFDADTITLRPRRLVSQPERDPRGPFPPQPRELGR